MERLFPLASAVTSIPLFFCLWIRTPLFALGYQQFFPCQSRDGLWTGWSFDFWPTLRGNKLYRFSKDRRRLAVPGEYLHRLASEQQ